jgi:hypothetical protein
MRLRSWRWLPASGAVGWLTVGRRRAVGGRLRPLVGGEGCWGGVVRRAGRWDPVGGRVGVAAAAADLPSVSTFGRGRERGHVDRTWACRVKSPYFRWPTLADGSYLNFCRADHRLTEVKLTSVGRWWLTEIA